MDSVIEFDSQFQTFRQLYSQNDLQPNPKMKEQGDNEIPAQDYKTQFKIIGQLQNALAEFQYLYNLYNKPENLINQSQSQKNGIKQLTFETHNQFPSQNQNPQEGQKLKQNYSDKSKEYLKVVVTLLGLGCVIKLNQQQMESLKSDEIFDNFTQYQKVVLIGGFGVGKSLIFKKVSQNESNHQGFEEQTITKLGFTLIDSPSFDLKQSLSIKDELIEQFSEFLNREKNYISTFFLIIKYERIDIMKQNFYSIIKHFQKYIAQFRVIVTFWDLRVKEKEKQIIEELEEFFLKCGVKFIGFIEKSTENKIIQQYIKKGLTNQKGITLENTIFEIQQNSGSNAVVPNFVMQKIIQDPKFSIQQLIGQYQFQN